MQDTLFDAVLGNTSLGFAPSAWEPRKPEPVYNPQKNFPGSYIPQAIMDIEVYANYFLIMFMRLEDNETISFELKINQELDVNTILSILRKYEIITFNGNNFDIPLLRMALSGACNSQLKVACDEIINGLSSYNFGRKHKDCSQVIINHIDLIEIAPSKVSLKTYGGRLHCPKLQDLPVEPGELLGQDQMAIISTYCQNDLLTTKRLFLELQEQIELRRTMSTQYKLDLRSRSDAQMAEEILKKEMGIRINKPSIQPGEFFYQRPGFIWSSNIHLRNAFALLESEPFTVLSSGKVEMPKSLSTLQIRINKSIYQMGMGGLHSTENGQNIIESETHIISDWDVASYYPAIILNLGIYPKHLGTKWLETYSQIVQDRLGAKAAGDKVKADSLKITVNGSFGKLGSPYSCFYDPEQMVKVTVTGQLSLLILIDQMELAGIQVASANTDGIVLYCPRNLEGTMCRIVKDWEEKTGFTMERSNYKALYSRDVNNYIAVKLDGKVKTKGCFKPGDLSKNPQNEICSLALIEYLKSGKPFIQTLKECTDVSAFITLRNVKGGAVKDDQYLGKVVRWYHAIGVKGTIKYKTNNHDVPCTEGAQPIMNLTDTLPENIDYNWYIKECKTMLNGLGLYGG